MIKNNFPPSLLENDKELEKFLEVLDSGISIIKNFWEIFSALKIENASRWLRAFGWKYNLGVDNRRILKSLFTIYRLSGTNTGIQKVLPEFLGVGIYRIWEAWVEAYKNRENISEEEKRKVKIYLSYRPYGVRTLDLIPLGQSIAEIIKPVHIKVIVEVQQNTIKDVGNFAISSLTDYTIKYVAYTPPEFL